MNTLLTLAFDGTNYHGFQVQRNAVTVCEVFQSALEKVIGFRADIKGCSRTDAGVHAKMYCISFRGEYSIPTARLVPALNSLLPDDIRVYASKTVPEEFHARYSCSKKQYLYRYYDGAVLPPFESRYAWHVPPLDAERMNEAAADFIGRYDYSAFCSAGDSVEDHVRTVVQASVERIGDTVEFTVAADGFLYNMVRIMASTLADASRKSVDIKAIIMSRDRTMAGATAPARGLFLNRVDY